LLINLFKKWAEVLKLTSGLIEILRGVAKFWQRNLQGFGIIKSLFSATS